MDHFVPFESFPSELQFPPELRQRIDYDPARKALVHHGPMSKREFDSLWSLHNSSEYRRAIEDLFRIATYEVPPHAGRRSKLAIGIGVGIAILVAVAIVSWLTDLAIN